MREICPKPVWSSASTKWPRSSPGNRQSPANRPDGTSATKPERTTQSMPENLSAERFARELEAHRSSEEAKKYLRYFKTGEGQYGEGDVFIGVRMGQVFALAKEFIDMPPVEIEKLLESPVHEIRAGGLSIMDKQGRKKKTPEGRRKELFKLYLRRTDRINNWDLVDLGAPYVV